MKKIIFGLVTLMLLVTMVGCASQTAATAEASDPTAQPQAATEEVKEPEVLGPVTLKVSGWTYDTEKVKENIATYQEWAKTQADPPVEVTVEWTDAGYDTFDTFITTVFTGNDSRDVLYSSDQWLAKWAEAGWIVPLEDTWIDVVNYKSDIDAFSLNAMTYNGKLYGIPYYTDVMYFVYNKAMLEDAGISAPPTTWAEVTEQSLLLKEKGIVDYPFQVGLAPGSWFDEAFFAMVYSEGGTMFDENLAPVFETGAGPAFDMMEWLAKGINEDEIIPKKVLEMEAPEVQQAFKSGDAAFVIVPGYQMREFNTPGVSEIAGNAAISMMPGSTHETEGYTRMYVMGNSATKDEATKQAAIDLINYWGGKTTVNGVSDFHIAKRWAVENGLGFSISSLWKDDDVQRTLSAMADTTVMQKQKALARAKEGMAAPWFTEWITFVRAEAQKALLAEQPTTTTLENIKEQWLSLQSE